MARHIPKPNPTLGIGRVPTPSVSDDQTIRFSFKYAYLDSQQMFRIDDRESAYFLCLFDRIKSVCSMKVTEFLCNANSSLRSHPINFAKDNVSVNGFTCLNKALREEVEDSAYQFSVSANEHGRVHGFLAGDTFFVVWFDPRHELYPGKHRG